jgi:hypothetical protein
MEKVDELQLYEKFPDPRSILPAQVLVVPEWRAKYTKYFYMFLEKIFNNVELTNRIKEFEAFLLPLAERDEFTRVLTDGQPVAVVFQQEVAAMSEWIAARNIYIAANLEPEGI